MIHSSLLIFDYVLWLALTQKQLYLDFLYRNRQIILNVLVVDVDGILNKVEMPSLCRQVLVPLILISTLNLLELRQSQASGRVNTSWHLIKNQDHKRLIWC